MNRKKLDIEALNSCVHNRNMRWIVGGLIFGIPAGWILLIELGLTSLVFPAVWTALLAGAVLMVLAVNKNGRYERFAIRYMICEGVRELEIGGTDSMPDTAYQVLVGELWYNVSYHVHQICEIGDILIVAFHKNEGSPICIQCLKEYVLSEELLRYVVSGQEIASDWEKEIAAKAERDERDRQYASETAKAERDHQAGKIDDGEKERRLRRAENRRRYYSELRDIKEKLLSGVISEEEYTEKFDKYMNPDE